MYSPTTAASKTSAPFKEVELSYGVTQGTAKNGEVTEKGASNGVSPAATDDPGQRRAIMKNVFIISIAFTFLFTAFNSMANLQSSINKWGEDEFSTE